MRAPRCHPAQHRFSCISALRSPGGGRRVSAGYPFTLSLGVRRAYVSGQRVCSLSDCPPSLRLRRKYLLSGGKVRGYRWTLYDVVRWRLCRTKGTPFCARRLVALSSTSPWHLLNCRRLSPRVSRKTRRAV